MARGKSGSTASEMLSGLKSRLGFSHNEGEDEEFARYDADFDDYDDFDDDYESEYDEEYEEYEEVYGDGSESSLSRSTSRTNRFGHPESTPNLVSADDVREHTKGLINSSRGSYEAAHRSDTSSRRSSGRSLIENRGPAPSSPAYNASIRESGMRSEGLNSLFESTSARESFSTASALPAERGLTVLTPVTYNDVEGVARALKAGNAVVLSMRNTPEELFKRILDFSFGVASALDASVDCPAAKVYAIIRGNGLTEEEKSRLRTQGVL